MGVLSEEEKEELRALARSSTIREEFRQLRKISLLQAEPPMDVDQLVRFLTTMARLNPTASLPRIPVSYKVVRI